MSIMNEQIAFFKMTGEESRMANLIEFFKHRYNLDILQEFKNRDSKKDKLSLRILDWFVTNYAKQRGVIYQIKKGRKMENFMVWISYDSTLSSEGKENFDPFCRGKKQGKIIELEYEQGKIIKTTLAQLNFFKWAIKYGVIDYVKKNLDSIYEDMQKRSSTNKTAKGKKQQLSVSVSKTLGHHDVQMTVSFKNQ